MLAIVGMLVIIGVGVVFGGYVAYHIIQSMAQNRSAKIDLNEMNELRQENLLLREQMAAVGGYFIATAWQSDQKEVRDAAVASLRYLNQTTQGVIRLEFPIE